MKKNKTMRIASVLLIAVLLTTSIISGTFAKYVTTGEASDSARVAKFGVVVTASGDLFSKTYYAVGQTNSNQPAPDGTTDTDNKVLTVEASEKVVAPGTKSNATTPFTLSVTGQPEVDVQVTVSIADTYKDVYLKAGTDLPDMTTGKTDTFSLGDDYYPITYTLTQTKNSNTSTLATGSLSAIVNALSSLGGYYNAGTDLSTEIGTLTLTWEWNFRSEQTDKEDTLLGDIVAQNDYSTSVTLEGKTLSATTDYSVEANISLTVTVAQVD